MSTEILWDTWGVPHIFAADDPGLFRGLGWAQFECHGDLILRLYGRARGRSAEYFGEAELASDKLVWTMGMPERAARWYTAQSPAMRANLDAFVAGMNDHAAAHPDALAEDARRVLPVTGADVFAHIQRILFIFLSGTGQYFASVPMEGLEPPELAGSNAWAIAPEKAAGGNALLLINPHLGWADFQLFWEAHVSGPDIDFSGAALVGWPMLVVGCNDHLGWMHTVNFIDAWDAYQLTPAGEDAYLFDGEARSYGTRTLTLKVRRPDGSLRDEPLTVRRSVHGPVVAELDGCPVAVRVVGVDQTEVPGIVEQYWQMARATTLAELETAVARMQMPMFSVVSAGCDGHIMHLFGGQVPKRPHGDFAYWSGIVPGDTSANFWHAVHDYADLPKIVNPPGGFVQNCNCPPWTGAWPPAIDAADYPAYMSGHLLGFRERRSLRMLIENARISFEDMLALKHSTRLELADLILDQLIAALRERGDQGHDLAGVLERWDRCAEADSRGAVLFTRWLETAPADGLFTSDPFDDRVVTGFTLELADPQAAADALIAAAEALAAEGFAPDVPWGDVNRLRLGGADLPSNGALGDQAGVFRFIGYRPDADGRGRAGGGETFVMAVEFSDPPAMRAVLTYGNRGPRHPEAAAQAALVARKQLREVWRTREEIEANTRQREVI